MLRYSIIIGMIAIAAYYGYRYYAKQELLKKILAMNVGNWEPGEKEKVEELNLEELRELFKTAT
jgi:hypothetical protein